MSEAGLPPNQSQPEPTPERRAEPSERGSDLGTPREAVRLPPISDPWDDDWETVNFPDAIAIDRLPVVTDSEETPPTPQKPAPVPVGEAVEGTRTPLIQALHTCNRDLIDRIAELEEELEHCHRRLQEQDTQINQQAREMGFARDQVTRLFRKLEVANRVIQQQQVLVETLTRQWDTGQTRMAQMERECASAQQRYNEQFHELVRAQTACRELRSRLHRQQRHTLQFKAALERSLEMQSKHHVPEARPAPPPLQTSEADDPELPADPRPSPSFVLRSPTLNLSKALPVQPWSSQLSDSADEESEGERISGETPPDDAGTSPTAGEEIRDSESQPAATAGEPESDATDLPVAEIYPDEPAVEEWPRPRFVEEELDRIRLEYAAPPPEQENVSPDRSESEEELAAIASGKRRENWPAPLVYPQRRRKLQSLSAIELPTFSTSAVEEEVEF